MLITEIWKDIPGYEGEYQASNLGRIKSLSRKVLSKNHYTGLPFYRTTAERILKPGKYCKSGHLSVVLRRGSQGLPVHQLIMKTFVGEPPVGKEVCHNNGNPADNRLSNLRYDTRTENIIDVYRQGKKWRKLSVNDVTSIKLKLTSGHTCTEIAKEYSVSIASISAIKMGRSFSWLK